MTRIYFKQHEKMLSLILVSVTLVFVFFETSIAVAHSKDCSDANDEKYAEGSRLGPFECQAGRWIYVGQ